LDDLQIKNAKNFVSTQQAKPKKEQQWSHQ